MKNLVRLFSSLLATLDRASLAFENNLENKWFNLLDRYFSGKWSYVICLFLVLTCAALVVYLQAVHAETLFPSKN